MMWPWLVAAIAMAGRESLLVGIRPDRVAKISHPRSPAKGQPVFRASSRSPASSDALPQVPWLSLLIMSCAWGQHKLPRSRRRLLGYLSVSAASQPALAAEMCEGSVFNGSWSIPESLGGKASITVRDGTAVITGSKQGQQWELRSTNIQGAPLIFRIAGIQRQFWVDWGPVGGPSELRGVWQGGMLDGPLATGPPEIKWDDGSRWRKVSCTPD